MICVKSYNCILALFMKLTKTSRMRMKICVTVPGYNHL